MLADKSDDGKELNAPNDGMVHPNDGSIWFTDPGYGALMNYEGKRYSTDNVQPFIKEAVYRIDAQSGKIQVMINIFGRSTPVELEYWQVENV